MKFETKMVSPQYAEALLGTTDKNRNVQHGWVMTLANEMRHKRWQSNGETIVVSASGKLLDGQHRLFAVIEYGAPVEMIIVTGAPDSAFETIDTGHSRSSKDILGMKGFAYGNILAAAAGAVWKLCHETSLNENVSPNMILDIVDRYPAFRKWTSHVASYTGPGRVLPPGCFLTALVYLEDIAKKPRLAETFFEGIVRGVGLNAGDPILTLRNRVINFRIAGGACTFGVCWEPTARTLSALESSETLARVTMGSKGGKIVRPKLFEEHIKELPVLMRLEDMKPRTYSSGQNRKNFKEFVEEVRAAGKK